MKICRNCQRSLNGRRTQLQTTGYCSCACRKARWSWANCAQCLRDCGLTTEKAALIVSKSSGTVAHATRRRSPVLLKSIPLKAVAKIKKNQASREYRDRLFAETGYRTTEEDRQKERENRPPDKKRPSPEARKRYSAKYLSKPENRLRRGLSRRLYKAVKFRGKSPQVEVLVGCSLADLKDWIESQFRYGMTWGNYGYGWHVDHIQPCALFDHENPEHVRRCWHFTNLRPLWASENIAKADRITEPQMHLAI